MNTTFSDLGVDAGICARLESRGIAAPFPVQAATIPASLEGRDIVAKAPTGSGKTLAFGVAAIESTRDSSPRRPRGLILEPTRELAAQVRDELGSIMEGGTRRIIAIYGGTRYGPAQAALNKGVDILVACPGRLEDLIEQGMVDLSEVRFVVIDVVATILAALGLALLLLRAGFARTVLRTLMILPFAVSPALIGISWRFMLNPEFGAIHHSIGALLPFMAKTDWFASPGLATAALISADLWHWAPYFAFMLMGGLASVPGETQEAARIDGASDLRVFLSITLPQMAPVIAVAVILKTVFALKVFDSIVTMTGGGPGLETNTLAFFAYNMGFRDYDMGYAAAIAYVLTILLFALSFSYMRFILPRGK